MKFCDEGPKKRKKKLGVEQKKEGDIYEMEIKFMSTSWESFFPTGVSFKRSFFTLFLSALSINFFNFIPNGGGSRFFSAHIYKVSRKWGYFRCPTSIQHTL